MNYRLHYTARLPLGLNTHWVTSLQNSNCQQIESSSNQDTAPDLKTTADDFNPGDVVVR